MTGRRRGIRLHRTPWGAAMWFLTSRLAITLAVMVALMVLVAVLALTRPWQALTEKRVVYVPVPGVVTDIPDSENPAPSDDGRGEAPRPMPATDRGPEGR